MAITTLSRLSLTDLQTLIVLALSTSEQAVDVRLRNTGKVVNNAPFMTINVMTTTSPGTPQRTQIDEVSEVVSEDRISAMSIQAYGAGAMVTLSRLRAWFGSSPGMAGLKAIGASCPLAEEPKDISAAVSTGFEERAAMVVTLSHTDSYQVEQATIAEVPVSIITDNPPSQTDFTITKEER